MGEINHDELVRWGDVNTTKIGEYKIDGRQRGICCRGFNRTTGVTELDYQLSQVTGFGRVAELDYHVLVTSSSGQRNIEMMSNVHYLLKSLARKRGTRSKKHLLENRLFVNLLGDDEDEREGSSLHLSCLLITRLVIEQEEI